MALFDSLLDLACDAVKVATAPVDVVVTVAAATVKPIAEVVGGLAEDIKSVVK